MSNSQITMDAVPIEVTVVVDNATITIQWRHKIMFATLIHKQRQGISIVVKPNTNIYVHASNTLAMEQIIAEVNKRSAWIYKQVSYFEAFNPRTTSRLYEDGETWKYLGRQYRLKIINSNQRQIKLSAGNLIVSSPTTAPAALARQLDQYYKQRAQGIFQEMLAEVLPMFEQYNLPVIDIQIKRMPKRWGSCKQTGEITLNPDLIKAPKQCIKYVMVHELCHLVHWHHNTAFYALQHKLLPDADRLKEKLEYWMS